MTKRRKPGALDEEAFVEQLGSAIAVALARCAARIGERTIDCLAIDVHPWSGFLNLSIRHENDEEPRRDGNQVWVADWELSHFAIAHERGDEAWHEARPLAERMNREFEARSDTALFYGLCAQAARDPRVWKELDAFTRSRAFRIVVPDVDCTSRPIEIAKPPKR